MDRLIKIRVACNSLCCKLNLLNGGRHALFSRSQHGGYEKLNEPPAEKVNFDAYLTIDFLNSIGINSPAECMAYLQKAGTSEDQALAVSRELFWDTVTDPGLTGGGYTFGGKSDFDFDGDNVDDRYLIASYGNSSWSEGNIGIVPEPAATAALADFAALGFVLTRRRR